MPGYNPQSIEKKWQQRWAQQKTFATAATPDKPKFYVLDMFPYPSGQGLHVGHPEGYTATDIVARYKRARGFNVMHPMGWDAFGLPAEQYAIKNNVHPRETTANNINRFRQQLQSLGFSYDWDREVDTTDPRYYKWTQWIFLKLYDTWFDEEQQKGRPISDLVKEFQSGKRAIPPITNYQLPITWDNLPPVEQRRILASYRLAYEAEVPVNWCPGLGTVLANEEVIDGKSEVGGFPVERRPMKQWMLRITKYAERLIAGLEKLEWTESLKDMQRNWIGKSDGAEVEFEISNLKSKITVFTTRPDTLFGATYIVRSPEHPLVKPGGLLVQREQEVSVRQYQKWVASRSDRERQEDTGKTGAFTGDFAINPVNGQRIPIWISDYVLMGYGTGAIMAVPAHDERDWGFAQAFDLPVRLVVEDPGMKNCPEYIRQMVTKFFGRPNAEFLQHDPHHKFGSVAEAKHFYFGDTEVGDEEVQFVEGDSPGTTFIVRYQRKFQSIKGQTQNFGLMQPNTHEGVAINSPWIDGLPTAQAKEKMITLLEEKSLGKRRVNYKIRDWLFSRQRYWGEPFPLVHLEDGTTVRLADDQLPVQLPELADFKPTGTIEPPLSKAAAWKDVHVVLSADLVARIVPAGTPGAVKARRELNTMPQWAGSCWYYIRYLDPTNERVFVDPAVERYWLGGTGSLASPTNGPGASARGYENGGGVDLYVGGVEHAVLHLLYSRFWHKVLFDWGLVSNDEPFRRLVNQGMILGENNEKMSKSRGNVVTSESMVEAYGADALRLFEMFMGPLEQVKPWSTAGVEGVYRFLQRVWRNLFDENDVPKVAKGQPAEAIARALHRLIKKVGEDIERLSFNTAIAEMMKFNNLVADAGGIDRASAITFVRLIEPFAPHFAEEVFERLSGDTHDANQAPGGNPRPDHSSITQLPCPTFDPAMLIDATLELPVQVNGKLRGKITVPSDADEATILAAALAHADVQKFLEGKEPKKKIYVKGRMVNLVV